MTQLEIILLSVAVCSILSTVFLFIYARAILARLLFVSDELGDLQDMINSFAKHLQSVYELETFYGDQTLQGLLEHAVAFNEQLETFKWIYHITTEEAEDDDDNRSEAENAPS